uniref:Uncharacterized protein n=1 Tax=Ciona intestinalis TaxID=7719 RepID=H2XN53_CIOIN
MLSADLHSSQILPTKQRLLLVIHQLL